MELIPPGRFIRWHREIFSSLFLFCCGEIKKEHFPKHKSQPCDGKAFFSSRRPLSALPRLTDSISMTFNCLKISLGKDFLFFYRVSNSFSFFFSCSPGNVHENQPLSRRCHWFVHVTKAENSMSLWAKRFESLLPRRSEFFHNFYRIKFLFSYF